MRSLSWRGSLRWVRRLSFTQKLALAAVVASVGVAYLASRYFGTLQGLGYVGAFLINVIGSSSVFLPLPGAVGIFALGATGDFSPVLLGLFAGLGGSLGEVTGYLAGYGGRAMLEGRPLYGRMVAWMRRRGGLTIFVIALVGVIPFDLTGIAAGALRYPVWRFLLFAALGKIPRFMLIAWSGGWGMDALHWLVGM